MSIALAVWLMFALPDTTCPLVGNSPANTWSLAKNNTHTKACADHPIKALFSNLAFLRLSTATPASLSIPLSLSITLQSLSARLSP